jgi:hypothetical protein
MGFAQKNLDQIAGQVEVIGWSQVDNNLWGMRKEEDLLADLDLAAQLNLEEEGTNQD